ncbi:GRP family sugar transporter [Parabacteroides sp. PF5-6]|uniref:GRP family sugar transporter n=1 Tax=Parabacteroides sp. PF5-6 TaxID=1742403 RepID=UPI002404E2C4|nr:GRP family sugar transporter [Parabacteroides sp. PF5-6]MDF9830451.1 glucose uptake protein [Parabacteroides sp. PF5-6]
MMNATDWLIAFIPIFSFGILPVVATRIEGKPIEQSMGVALGSVIFALIFFFFRRPELDASIFIISFLSGLCWAVGSLGQFAAIRYLGVSKSIPILNGGQIVTTSLLGILLGEWATTTSRAYGFAALILIIGGIVLTSYKEEKAGEKTEWRKGLLINLMAILGYTAYIGILKYFQIDGWSTILPQSFGQVAGVVLIGLLFYKSFPMTRMAGKNSIGGLIWAVGNIALLISQLKLGLAVAYPVSQAAIVVAVLGGVFINKEHKNRKEWMAAVAGMAVIMAGLYLIYLSSVC